MRTTVMNETVLERAAKAVVSRAEFGQEFAWGVATSAFQIEGGTRQGGRGESIWDRFCQVPGAIADSSNGDVACDHYNRLEEDLDLIAELGVGHYRFSIAWPRVQPRGTGYWNEEGMAFYDRVIAGLTERGIQAHITLNHWDLPQALQDQGGWQNRATCHHFVRYATEIAARFGNRVSSIVTHNEPWVVAVLGHEHGIFAPGLQSRALAMQVSHHLLLSHGMAVQAMRELHIRAELGLVLNLSPIYPATSSPEDMAKAKLDDGLVLRWYMDPVFKGFYPEDVLAHLGQDAPQTEAGDLQIINQPIDFLGVNYYTRNFSSSGNPWDAKANGSKVTDMGWEVYPQGLTELLERLHRDYAPEALVVTENGAAFKDELVDGQIHDAERLEYFQTHIQACLNALKSKVPLKGYFAWSLMDNFEWASGYAKRFGLIYVDYASQRRIFKDSAHWYRAFLGRN
jgi:beta-glucosidase